MSMCQEAAEPSGTTVTGLRMRLAKHPHARGAGHIPLLRLGRARAANIRMHHRSASVIWSGRHCA